MNMSDFIEEKLNYYADAIINGHDKIDEHAFGEMKFYMTLRRVINNKATLEDVGMMDAINDTLQELGLIKPEITFYKM